MGVQTSSDDSIDAAREAVLAADEALAEAVLKICIKDTWGADQWSQDFKNRLRQASFDMHKIREAIE